MEDMVVEVFIGIRVMYIAARMVELEVQDLAHLTRITSALRASDAVAQAERI